MPYARRRSTRRVTRRSRRSTRSRRYTTRRVPYRRRRLPVRRILNITSTKKSDTRLPVSTLPLGAGSPAQPSNGGVQLNGDIAYMCAYIPTAQDKTNASTVHDVESYRTSSQCFIRGYKENLRMTINNGTSWMWRRICFSYKGSYLTGYPAALNDNERFDWETSSGWTRVWNNHNPHNTGARLRGEMFKGTQGVDWIDIFTAPLDTDRINVKYDKFRALKNTGGNADVRIHEFSLWHGMNANLDYDDDENGVVNELGKYSTTGNDSMGDYYIVDLFQCAASLAANTMTIFPTGRLYWHEK